jgi:hypothetical protein
VREAMAGLHGLEMLRLKNSLPNAGRGAGVGIIRRQTTPLQ